MPDVSRRSFGALAFAMLSTLPDPSVGAETAHGNYGQINRLMAVPGQGTALLAELQALGHKLAEALHYAALIDPAEPETVWTIELWQSQAAHDAAIANPDVQAAIKRCKPLIKRFEHIATFNALDTTNGK